MESPAEIKEGAVYRATIKERVSDNEAILQIRGKEQLARFEDGVPASGNRVTIQVNEKNEQMIHVKTIDTESAKSASNARVINEENVLKSLGLSGKESTGLKQAVQILLDKGSPLSKETVQDLKNFMDKATGTAETKIETVKALANKRLEPTQPQLRAVHEALHGKPLNEVLTDIAKEIDPEFKLENKDPKIPQQNIQKTNIPTNPVETAKPTPVQQAEPIQSKPPAQSNQLSELVRKSREMVEQEPNLKKAIQQIKEVIIKNPNIDRDLAQKVEKAVSEAEKLQSIGKDRLLHALKGAEEQLLKSEQQSVKAAIQQKSTDTLPTKEAHLASAVKDLQNEVSKSPNLPRFIHQVKELIAENPRFPKELTDKANQAVNEASALAKQGRMTTGREVLSRVLAEIGESVEKVNGKAVNLDIRPSEVVREVKAEVQRNPNLQQAIEKVRDLIVNHPKVDREVVQKVEQALKEVAQLQQAGRESVGRDRLQQALTKAEVELKQIESRQPAQPTQVPQTDRSTTAQQPSEIVKEVKAEVQRNPNLQQAIEKVRDQVVNHPKMDREVAQKVEQALKEASQLQQIGRESVGRERLQQALAKAEVELKQLETRQPTQVSQPERSTAEQRPSDILKEVKTEIQREPNLQRAIEKVRDQVVNHPKMDREVSQKVEQALKEASQLQQIGKESVGRDRLQQALAKAEVELKQIEIRQPAQQSQNQLNSETKIEPNSKQTETQPIKQEPNVKDSIQQVREQIKTESDTNKVLQKVQDLITNNKNIDPQISKDIERLAKQANQLDQAGRERLVKMLQQVEAALKQETQTKGTDNGSEMNQKEQSATKITQPMNNLKNADMTELAKSQEVRPSDTINQALKQLQKEPNLEHALEQVRKEITSNPSIDVKTIERAEKAINNANQLLDRGREIAARQQITSELSEIEQELAKAEPKVTPDQKLAQYDLNEQLQSMQVQSKDILVTKVSQKLAQATHDFRELKREISRSLDNVHRLVETFKNNAYPQAKQMLETAISKLDNAILKSEMMLFTDMKTEKQLMQASSQLAEAKKLLAKGDHAQAGKIVHDVKNLVDKLIFKPSEQKIMHFINKESMALENRTPGQQMLAQFGETTRGYAGQEASPRQMFEMVRSLGLNHDSDVAQSLVFQKGDQSQENQQQQQNLKAVLMKLAQGEETNTKITQHAEQALTNLTGQQLLSKSDATGTLQSMFFNLPLLLGGKPENLQVFVNSKNEGQQVDWQNCNLYFLLETKKLGDVGILLNSTDKNLSITIKNDLPGFKEKMEPLAAFTKDKLQEVGYNVSSLSFTRMTPIQTESISQNEPNAQAKPTRPVFTEKGMDFKI